MPNTMAPSVRRRRLPILLAAVAVLAAFQGVSRDVAARIAPAPAQAPTTPAARPAVAPERDWGPWLEPGTPFFSSVLDVRRIDPALPADNLTPRGLMIPAGNGHWVAFDTDLLRVAAVWQGAGVTPRALAPGSYHAPDKKTPGGQNALPEPDGTVWMANGIYPGWQVGERPRFDDPREPAPSPEEVGRGPLPEAQGRFTAVHLTGDGAVLAYRVGETDVRERVTAVPSPDAMVVRQIDIGATTGTLWLVLGVSTANVSVAVAAEGDARPVLEQVQATLPRVPSRESEAAAVRPELTNVWAVRVPAHASPRRFSVAIGAGRTGAVDIAQRLAAQSSSRALALAPAAPRWRQAIETRIVRSTSPAPYVVDDVPLPIDNPWRRNVRISDIQFLPDGTGIGVTLDGDVWTITGLASDEGVVRWRRFASGLHEPLTVAVRDGVVYAFDRNGVWALRDTNGDGEADVHELFSNAFAQTADMREFPSTIRLGPRGEFVIAKGGQEATTIGKHNGSVLRLSSDGRTAEVLGYGLRQPQLSVHPRTGLVISSDQQGHYIPSTPLHIVRGRQFYGFLSDKLPREVYPAPIAEPLAWIPHSVNASAMSQVWLLDAKMGPLDGDLVHIAYNRPELFRVLLDLDRPKPEAVVVSITADFDYPPLNGSVNPADGQLYIAGFQIIGWGTTATRMAGLGRVRYTGAPVTLPRQVAPTEQGVLLRFDVPLDKASAEDAANYTLASWQYRRSFRYGSPQLKADGTPGTDALVPSHAYLAADGRSVFVAVPGMAPSMQLEVSWHLKSDAGLDVKGQAYTTPYALRPFDPKAEGFGDLTIDLTPRAITSNETEPAGEVSVAEGRRVYEQFGCMACHAIERGAASRLGPPLIGIYGSPRPLADRQAPVIADEVYLREAIREPASAIVAGYENSGVGMPSFAGVLTDAEIESVVQFIKSLR
jgi:cytochrome c2